MTSEVGVTSDDVDKILAALSHHQRRETLNILRNAGRSLALADLSIELTLELEDFDSKAEAKKRAERLQIELYHSHVPRLEEAGLIDYNVDRNVVALTDTATDGDLVETEEELTTFAL